MPRNHVGTRTGGRVCIRKHPQVLVLGMSRYIRMLSKIQGPGLAHNGSTSSQQSRAVSFDHGSHSNMQNPGKRGPMGWHFLSEDYLASRRIR